MKVYLQIAFHLPSFVAFRNKCPCPSERNFRATALCNTSLALNYSCLFDENRGFNVESCITKTDFAPPGMVYVFLSEMCTLIWYLSVTTSNINYINKSVTVPFLCFKKLLFHSCLFRMLSKICKRGAKYTR